MGDKPCHLCATPGAKITALGTSECAGCGTTAITLVMDYMTAKARKALKDITFSDATFAYERSPFASRISFGEYLVLFSLNLIGRP
jgi:hypothetical protein